MPRYYFKVLRKDLTSVGLLGAPRLQYKVGEWVRPKEVLSRHPRKGGGLWVSKSEAAARHYCRYLGRKRGLRNARVFICRIGRILHDASKNHKTSPRVKTDRLKLLAELVVAR